MFSRHVSLAQIANLKDELQRKAAEVERLQQLKAEAVNRANALATAAAAAPTRAAPDRRLSEGGLAKRALSPEKQPEKNARVKRLGEAMTAIVEESEAPGEVGVLRLVLRWSFGEDKLWKLVNFCNGSASSAISESC